MYDLVILYSGGVESRILLELAKELDLKPYCVLIDYEQLHIEELKFAKSHLEKEMIDYQVVKIHGLNINSGLTGSGVQDQSGVVHSHYVPGRNTMFLSIAFSIAECKKIDNIWFGGNFSDRLNLFPDCYQDYVVSMNELFKYAGSKPISVEAPLMGLTKETILLILKKIGIEKHEVFSGYGDFS